MLRILPRLDPHPPLYYLQLHYWPGLLRGDAAVRWNSVLWSMAAVLFFGLGTARLFGWDRAWLVAGLVALNPLAVAYSNSVRMYAMLMALAGVCYCGVALVETARNRREMVAGAVLAAAAAAAGGWTQGAGFLLPVALTAYFALGMFPTRQATINLIFPLAASIAACATLAPWLLHAREVHVNHLYQPDTEHIITSLKQLLFAQVRWPSRLVYISVATFAIGLCVAAAWRDRKAFRLVLCFIALPLALCAILSQAMSPIWDTRTFAWCAPFLCVAAGVAFYTKSDAKSTRILAALGILALVGGSIHALYRPVVLNEGYRQCATHIQEDYPQYTLLFAPKRDLWCIGWYAGLKGQIHPLDTTTVQGDVLITSRASADLAENRKYILMLCREGHEADIEPTRALLHAELLTHAAFDRVHLYVYSLPLKPL